MNMLAKIYIPILENSKSFRVTVILSSLLNLISVCGGYTAMTQVGIWTVDEVHWELEHFIFDVVVAAFICIMACMIAWMDTIRPLNKKSKAKARQIAELLPVVKSEATTGE